ncbi:MAG: flagellar biosynthesis anti-sigma factor FlgM [Candidatus Palauibacterales bacterium]|nr:flagellar biosynthesis anti-sigma factor FlgM [Candidatus Palauibacterales bacterium]
MNIGNIGPLESLGSRMAERLRELAGSDSGDSGDGTSRVQEPDQVDLSDAGRALADRARTGEGEELTEERAAEIRERIDDGVYDSPEVVEETARQLLESGDLEQE